jgi:hypothetical protein
MYQSIPYKKSRDLIIKRVRHIFLSGEFKVKRWGELRLLKTKLLHLNTIILSSPIHSHHRLLQVNASSFNINLQVSIDVGWRDSCGWMIIVVIIRRRLGFYCWLGLNSLFWRIILRLFVWDSEIRTLSDLKTFNLPKWFFMRKQSVLYIA